MIYPVNAAFSRFVDTDLSLTVNWQASRNVNVGASFTHFFAGEFIRENKGEDVNFGTFWMSCKF